MAAAKHRRRNTIVTLIVLLPIAAVVIYTSFQVSDFECEVCMAFEGQSTCRTVTGKTEQEGLRTGVDNACAILSSGVTDTLRCQRTLPTKATCKHL
ncbi:MAG TPA: hypothetical protein VL049_10060 [Candidatus Dormibacteraeota bacterium]|nr:hypothetical protein [Candidatus Dormibacteraeota bacterium]